MIPHERSLVEKLKDKPFALVGVNSDPTVEKLKEVQKKENITWRSFFAGPGGGEIAKAWNVSGWPTIYILDATGKIRFKDLRDAEMEEAVMKLLAEAKQK